MVYHKVGQKAYHTSPIFMEVQIKMRYHLTPVGIRQYQKSLDDFNTLFQGASIGRTILDNDTHIY